MVAEEAGLVAKLRRERNGEESEYDKGVGVGGWGSLFTPRVDTGPLAPAVLRTVAGSPGLLSLSLAPKAAICVSLTTIVAAAVRLSSSSSRPSLHWQLVNM